MAEPVHVRTTGKPNGAGSAESVSVAGAGDEADWDAYVLSRTEVPPLALYRLGRVLQQGCGVPSRSLVARDAAGRVVGVLPAYVTRSLRGRASVHSPSYGLIADDEAVAAALCEALAAWAADEGAGHGLVHTGYTEWRLGCRRLPRTTVRFDIAADAEACWKGLRDKTRNTIRKGRRNGLELDRGPHLYGEFHEIYGDRLAHKGQTFLPHGFFREMVREYGERCEVLIARKDGRAIGGMFVVFGSDTALYLAGGARPGDEALAAPHFLMWETIELCRERGVRTLDMGQSAEGGGVYRFKTLFGGVPAPVHYVDPLTPAPEDEQDAAPPTSAAPQLNLAGRVEAAMRHHLPMPLRRRYLTAVHRRGRMV